MNVNEVFPSKYLKAADLQGKEPQLVISEVVPETIGNDQKQVVYFENKEKGVVLNKTNAMNIAAAYGDETDDWAGKSVVLFSVWTDFQGKSVQAIRIRPAQARRTAAPQQTRQAPQDSGANRDLDDDIPF